jgi:hypothetical protein
MLELKNARGQKFKEMSETDAGDGRSQQHF